MYLGKLLRILDGKLWCLNQSGHGNPRIGFPSFFGLLEFLDGIDVMK